MKLKQENTWGERQEDATLPPPLCPQVNTREALLKKEQKKKFEMINQSL